jgi:hypothetical protein
LTMRDVAEIYNNQFPERTSKFE